MPWFITSSFTKTATTTYKENNPNKTKHKPQTKPQLLTASCLYFNLTDKSVQKIGNIKPSSIKYLIKIFLLWFRGALLQLSACIFPRTQLEKPVFSVEWPYEIIFLSQFLVMVCRLVIKVLNVLKFLAVQYLKHLHATEVSSKLAPVQ